MPDRKIVFRPAARRQFDKLPAPVKYRVAAAIQILVHNPRPEGTKKLKGYIDYYRLRVGDYRIVYTLRDLQLVVLVIRIAPRKDVYKGL